MSVSRRLSAAREAELAAKAIAFDSGIAVAQFSGLFHEATMGLGCKALESISGVDRYRLAHWGGERADTLNGVCRVVVAAAVCGHPETLEEMNRVAGYVAFRLPMVEGPMTSNVMQALADDMKEFGELTRSVADAIGDGTITETEMEKVRREGHETIAAIQRTLALMEHEMEQGATESRARDSKPRSAR